MNIKLICDKKSFNFDLPIEANLKYVKKLSSKLFKCDLLDIYYKGDKITKEENQEKKLLRDIISDNDSNIKLKIVLNSTLNSTKNQTPSTTNSPRGTNKTSLNLGDIKIYDSKNMIYPNHNNKLFEAIYKQKSKKLISSIKDFNRKIIEIDNFLFKKNMTNKNDNLNNFEKNLYEFIDGLRIYFTKLVTALDYNNYASYNDMIRNLEVFYDFLNNDENMGHDFNCKTCREIENNLVSNFPINLKKCDTNFSLNNAEKCNYFNKSSKKPSIKKDFIINNMKTLKNSFEIKASSLKVSQKINKINNIEEIDTIRKDSSKYKKLIISDNNINSISQDNNNNNFEDKSKDDIEQNNIEDKKSDNEEKKLDLNSSKKLSECDISKKSINNISAIMNKTNDSNKNIMNEEEINNINNITNHSNKLNDNNNEKNNNDENNEEQKISLNENLLNNKNENKIYKEQKTSNLISNIERQKLKLKSHLNSTIKENENENCSNSSYFNNSNNKGNNKNNNNSNISKHSNKSNNNSLNNNIKKSINIKSINKQKSENKDIIQNEKEPSINNNSPNKKNIASSCPKTQNNQKKRSVQINEPRKSILAPPIYHLTSSNENEMAKVLSRKMAMKKKKNKTSNRYDFLI